MTNPIDQYIATLTGKNNAQIKYSEQAVVDAKNAHKSYKIVDMDSDHSNPPPHNRQSIHFIILRK